jgi:NAD(P)-dependent dehydrogenase (short-subunit alcohol dehydrogenase family)
MAAGFTRNDRMDEHTLPPQHQPQQPGIESRMHPRPVAEDDRPGCGRLRDKIALITGGDSGIGRAVAIAYAKEGAHIVFTYLNEHSDAEETKRRVERHGVRCVAISGDLGDELACQRAVQTAVDAFGRVDILVNNAAEQHPQESIEDISAEQLERTFRTNIFAYFFMVKAALKHMAPGSAIINTTSVTAYKGNPKLLDYSATKGAIVAFTRSLSASLVEQGIRVNAVAPGPIWTPLIPASFDAKRVSQFGSDTPMGRPGQPNEVASCFVFLASADSSYMSGQILHPNGGTIVGA